MQRSLKQRLLAGGLWVILGKAVTATSTVLIGALLTRLLPKAAVGDYFLAERLIWLVAILSLLGLHPASVRLIAEGLGTGHSGRARAAIGIAFRWAGAGALAAAAFLAAGGGSWVARAVWDAPGLSSVMGWVALWAALLGLQMLTSEIFRGFQDLRSATIFGGVITGALTVGMLAALYLTGRAVTLGQVIGLTVGAAAGSLLLGLVILRRKVVTLDPPAALSTREVMGIALPLWINGLMSYALTQSDVLILGGFRSQQEVAVYGAAARLVSLVLMTLMLVNLVVPPFIAELYARGDRRRLERMLRLTAAIAGLPAVAVLLVYLLFGSELLALVYGEGYAQGATVLSLLSLGRLAHVLTGSASITLGMTGFHRALMQITVVTSLLTVAAALGLVRPFGSEGIAAAISGGVVVHSTWVWLAARYHTGMWTHVKLPKVADLRELFAR